MFEWKQIQAPPKSQYSYVTNKEEYTTKREGRLLRYTNVEDIQLLLDNFQGIRRLQRIEPYELMKWIQDYWNNLI